jgi:hypothetical protein
MIMDMSFYSALALSVLAFAMTLDSLSTVNVFLRTRDEPELSLQNSYGIFAFAAHYFFGLLISCVLTLMYPKHTYVFAPVVVFAVSSIFIFRYFIIS